MDDNLVLILLGNLFPVILHGFHLSGVGDGFGQFSELDKLFDTGQGLELNSSEFHVLLVERGPCVIVDINYGGFLQFGGIFFGGFFFGGLIFGGLIFGGFYSGGFLFFGFIFDDFIFFGGFIFGGLIFGGLFVGGFYSGGFLFVGFFFDNDIEIVVGYLDLFHLCFVLCLELGVRF